MWDEKRLKFAFAIKEECQRSRRNCIIFREHHHTCQSCILPTTMLTKMVLQRYNKIKVIKLAPKWIIISTFFLLPPPHYCHPPSDCPTSQCLPQEFFHLFHWKYNSCHSREQPNQIIHPNNIKVIQCCDAKVAI